MRADFLRNLKISTTELSTLLNVIHTPQADFFLYCFILKWSKNPFYIKRESICELE